MEATLATLSMDSEFLLSEISDFIEYLEILTRDTHTKEFLEFGTQQKDTFSHCSL